MTVLNADALLEGIPFLSKRSRGSLPSIRSTEWTTHSISLAAKVAVFALVCTNLVRPAQIYALFIHLCLMTELWLACMRLSLTQCGLPFHACTTVCGTHRFRSCEGLEKAFLDLCGRKSDPGRCSAGATATPVSTLWLPMRE